MAIQASRLNVRDEGEITRIQFLERNLLEETSIQQIGDELCQIVDLSPTPKLLIMFENVEHLSSAALGMLIRVNNKIRQKGGQLRLSDIDPQIFEVFTITRLNKLFQIYDRALEAEESFK